MIEKLKIIWHLFRDEEYAFYSATVKDGKRVKGRTSCYISDNATDIFLNSVSEFSEILIQERKDEKIKNNN